MDSFPWDDQTVLILADGQPLCEAQLRKLGQTADIVVGVDGGTRQALAVGLRIDLVLGDFDSLGQEIITRLKESGIPLISYPSEKDATDAELALRLALASKAGEVVVVSGVGDRLDHSLANLFLLSKYAQQVRLTWETSFGRIVFLTAHTPTYEANLPPGKTFSIIALDNLVEGLSISGAKYPLNNVSLGYGATVGVSNQSLGGPIRLAVANGTCAVIFV